MQAPSYMRWIFLVLVPINLSMDLQQGIAMDAPALVGLLFVISTGTYLFPSFNVTTVIRIVELFCFFFL